MALLIGSVRSCLAAGPGEPREHGQRGQVPAVAQVPPGQRAVFDLPGGAPQVDARGGHPGHQRRAGRALPGAPRAAPRPTHRKPDAGALPRT
eukprot:2712119-Pyramimonas_sp.AAC.1